MGPRAARVGGARAADLAREMGTAGSVELVAAVGQARADSGAGGAAGAAERAAPAGTARAAAAALWAERAEVEAARR